VMHQMTAAERTRVVIVGAGFGGLSAVEHLAHVPVDVTLVDQHDYHTFQPLLYEVATSLLNAEDVGRPVRDIAHHQTNATFRQATATGVNWETHQLHLMEGRALPFDYLVLATGATASYFGIPGGAAYALPLYTLPDAVRLRNQIMNRFEAADRDPALVSDGALTFVVVGGGPTGVETAGALADLFQHELRRDYPDLAVNRAHIILIQRSDSVLRAFKEQLRGYARTILEDRGVEVRLGVAVTEVSNTGARLSSGEALRAHTVIWAGGLQAGPLADELGLPQGRRGTIVTGADLSVAGHPNVFVIGDLAQMTDGGHLLPQLARPAIESGAHAARQITRRLMGEPGQPFHYVDLGTMATIGRGTAVCEFPTGLTLQGPVAWLAWLMVHLVELGGMRNRVDVLGDWGWNLLTHERAARIVIDPAEIAASRQPHGGSDVPPSSRVANGLAARNGADGLARG
jgi:NADH:ubiquinone reductase (H+-translocating)